MEEKYRYAIKTSRRSAAKGVYFSLYDISYWYNNTKRYYFRARLSTDFDKAMAKAIEIVGEKNKDRIMVVDEKAFCSIGEERRPVIKCGKYKYKTIDEVWVYQPSYIMWIAREHPRAFRDITEDCINMCIANKKNYVPINDIFIIPWSVENTVKTEPFTNKAGGKYNRHTYEFEGDKYAIYTGPDDHFSAGFHAKTFFVSFQDNGKKTIHAKYLE